MCISGTRDGCSNIKWIITLWLFTDEQTNGGMFI